MAYTKTYTVKSLKNPSATYVSAEAFWEDNVNTACGIGEAFDNAITRGLLISISSNLNADQKSVTLVENYKDEASYNNFCRDAWEARYAEAKSGWVTVIEE
jgi:hypothetical protein